jgi:hypothetical protein
MTDFSVFWVTPVLFLFATWFIASLAPLIKEYSDCKWLWPAPLLFLILMHVGHYYNRANLHSVFHGGSPHMGYYEALIMYGNSWHQWFNWILLGISALYCVVVFIACLFNSDLRYENKK